MISGIGQQRHYFAIIFPIAKGHGLRPQIPINLVMANSDANPPLNNHMDDGTQHSLESSPETDTLGKTWTTEAPDPAVPRLVNPIVRMPAPGQDMSASQQVEADGTEGKDVEAGMSREDERNAQSEVQGARDSGNSGFPEEAIQEIQNVRRLSARE